MRIGAASFVASRITNGNHRSTAYCGAEGANSQNVHRVVRNVQPATAPAPGEAEAAQESENQYGDETVTAWRHAVKVKMTYDQLIMSPFNMEAEVSVSVGKSFAKKEGWMFLKGDGNKKPAGCTIDGRVEKIVSGTTAKVSFDDIANLIGSMKAATSEPVRSAVDPDAMLP